jgi:hypothetical protein
MLEEDAVNITKQLSERICSRRMQSTLPNSYQYGDVRLRGGDCLRSELGSEATRARVVCPREPIWLFVNVSDGSRYFYDLLSHHVMDDSVWHYAVTAPGPLSDTQHRVMMTYWSTWALLIRYNVCSTYWTDTCHVIQCLTFPTELSSGKLKYYRDVDLGMCRRWTYKGVGKRQMTPEASYDRMIFAVISTRSLQKMGSSILYYRSLMYKVSTQYTVPHTCYTVTVW